MNVEFCEDNFQQHYFRKNQGGGVAPLDLPLLNVVTPQIVMMPIYGQKLKPSLSVIHT